MPGLMHVFSSTGVEYTTPHTSRSGPLTHTQASGKHFSRLRAFPVVLRPGSGLDTTQLPGSHTHAHTAEDFGRSATFSLSLTHTRTRIDVRKSSHASRCQTLSSI